MANEIQTIIKLRNDTEENWLKSTVQLRPGEAAVSYDANGKAKLKFGAADGLSSWNDLKYVGGEAAQHFQLSSVADLEGLSATHELHPGDTAIVKEKMTNDKGEVIDQTSWTAYVYSQTDEDKATGHWEAMDGNYDARNVYFNDDFIYTEQFGALSATSQGKGTLSAKGKSLKTVLGSILMKEANPTITQPSGSLSLSKTTHSGELGASFDYPTATLKVNEGTYQYDTTTGVEFDKAKITCDSEVSTPVVDAGHKLSNGGTVTLKPTKGLTKVYGKTSQSITFNVTELHHTEGAIPHTNAGNEYKDGKIVAGDKTCKSQTATFTGWAHGIFVGAFPSKKTITQADADAIKKFDTKHGNINNGDGNGTCTDLSFNIKPKDWTIVIAALGTPTLTKVFNQSIFQEITSSFTKIGTENNQIRINGAQPDKSDEHEYSSLYTVWTFTPSGAYAKDAELKITLS